ncbi:MAG: PspC domain-containing protein [Sphingobacteriales bacterium]|nr:MAG: PspC domain-containing protein [Sphingobacteriales bacterium]
MSKKLTRNLNDKMIAGVAAGLAQYFQLEVTWVRIAFVLATFFGGGGLWIYLILWIAVPENSNSFSFDTQPPIVEDFVYNDLKKTKRKKEKINGSLIGGLIMIALGSYFLLDEFNIIPDWFNISKLWPLIFVFIGLSILVKGAKKEAAEKQFDTTDFKKTTEPEPMIEPEKKIDETL